MPSLPRLSPRSSPGTRPSTEPSTGEPDHLEGADVPRRSVLRAAGIAGVTVLVAGTGVASYRVYDTAVLAPGRGDAFDPWRAWTAPGLRGCVAAAVLAANPHNSQPWTFAISERAIDLYADLGRGTGALDPLGRERDVGLGCALENLVLAAQARGLAPTVSLLPDGPDAGRVASISVEPAAQVAPTAPTEPNGSPLYRAIGDRHTNRGPYRDEPLPAAVLERLVDLGDLTGLAVTWVTEPRQRTVLGDLMVEAAEAITQDDGQSRDSFAWFRPNADAVRTHRDGLTLDGQGMAPVMLTVAKLLPASSREAGDRFWVNQTRDVHTRTAAAYGVLTAADPGDRATRLRAGRLLQRIHLTATTRNVALHHMNQITERIDREQVLGLPARFAPRFAAFVPAGSEPVATFRVGHAVRAARPSPRRPVEAVLR
jgi:hypothetical protein